MSKRMEIVERVYKGGTISKIINLADTNLSGYIRGKKGGDAASPYKPDKGHTGKHKKINEGNRYYQPTGNKICLLHGTGHSSEECDVLRDYSENTPISGHTRNLALEANKNAVDWFSLKKRRQDGYHSYIHRPQEKGGKSG